MLKITQFASWPYFCQLAAVIFNAFFGVVLLLLVDVLGFDCELP